LFQISEKKIIFWDFDGVIKDSVLAKGETFAELFGGEDEYMYSKVLRHHCNNAGLPRAEKIIIYLGWAQNTPLEKHIKYWEKKFNEIVVKKVCESPWVPGALQYLQENYHRQHFVLVPATPQEEMDQIVDQLQIYKFFKRIYGHPNKKTDVIASTLDNLGVKPSNAVMLGDSVADYGAALENNVMFGLRRTDFNADISLTNTDFEFRHF